MHLALIGDELFIRGFSTWGNQGLKPHSVGYSIPNFATIPKIFGTGSGKNKYAFKDFFYRETTVVGGKTFKPGTVKEEVVAEFIEKQKDADGKTVGKTSLNPPTPPSVASGAAPVA